MGRPKRKQSQENGKKWTHSLKKELDKRIGFMRWLPTYSKMDAISDLIAGVTLGLTIVPQSMAYATLARLPPKVPTLHTYSCRCCSSYIRQLISNHLSCLKIGLNSAFAGGFLYVLFGTIKQVSIGPTSLMSLLTLQYISEVPQEYVMQYLCLLTFLCGCVELLMGLMRLGMDNRAFY